MSAGWAKIFSADPKLGFLAHASLLHAAAAAGTLPAGVKTAGDALRMSFNDYLDAAVAGFFMISVVVILGDSIREWAAVLRGRKPATSTEAPFQPRVAVAGD
jgi:carbon starvation protein